MNTVLYAILAAVAGGFIYVGKGIMMDSRGIRNNNPGNIRLTDIQWEGKVPNSDNTDREFEQFVSPYYGIRAMARNMLTHYERGENTIARIVRLWAPPIGKTNDGGTYKNDTPAYVRSVEKQTGIDADGELSPGDIPAVIAAMIVHENGGQPYSQDIIMEAVKGAGWGIA